MKQVSDGDHIFYPDIFPPDNRSEILTKEFLSKFLDKSYFVLCGFRMRHARPPAIKRSHEFDFVIFKSGYRAVFLLEAKGGCTWRTRQGRWYQEGHEDATTDFKGHLEQKQDALLSIVKIISKEYWRVDSLMYFAEQSGTSRAIDSLYFLFKNEHLKMQNKIEEFFKTLFLTEISRGSALRKICVLSMVR